MALVTKFTRGPANQTTRLLAGYKTVGSNVLDFGLVDHGVDSGDVVLILRIPPNAVVTSVKYEVIEGEGSIVDMIVGDGLVQNAWVASVSVQNTPGTAGQVIIGDGLVPAAGQEKLYPKPAAPVAADSIIMVPSADLSNLKIWFAVEYYMKEIFENV